MNLSVRRLTRIAHHHPHQLGVRIQQRTATLAGLNARIGEQNVCGRFGAPALQHARRKLLFGQCEEMWKTGGVNAIADGGRQTGARGEMVIGNGVAVGCFQQGNVIGTSVAGVSVEDA